jgi:hypothetical protein
VFFDEFWLERCKPGSVNGTKKARLSPSRAFLGGTTILLARSGTVDCQSIAHISVEILEIPVFLTLRFVGFGAYL